MLVALVVFVFLRTMRASIIPLVTIPVSLIGAFGIMAAAGFTINTLTLLALVLAIGLVVDDAIVVLENIFRHIEEGLEPFQAALKGAKEISFAVVAMTLTLAAVYAPLAFTPGRTGRLFTEFALTLAGAVIVSGFVALTLTPMMCSKLLRHNPAPEPLRPRHGARARGAERRLRRGAALGADAALDRAAGHGRGRRRQLVAVQQRQERTGAAGRPRRDPGHRQRAGRRDAGVHRALPARHRGHRPHLPGVRPRVRRRRQPDGVAGHFLHAHRRLGRAQAQHAGAGARAAAAVHGPARRDRLSDHAAAAWGRAFASARSTTSSSPATATRTWRGCRSSSWPRWPRTRASCSPTPTCG